MPAAEPAVLHASCDLLPLTIPLRHTENPFGSFDGTANPKDHPNQVSLSCRGVRTACGKHLAVPVITVRMIPSASSNGCRNFSVLVKGTS